MKKIFFGGSLGLFALALSFNVAFAADIKVGNAVVSQTNVDTYRNFVIVDKNNPVDVNGFLTQFQYYAFNNNPFKFLLVDSTGKVQWISDQIIPNGTGAQNYSPGQPVEALAGWNLGVYFTSTGTIPFKYDTSAQPASWTPNNSGAPTPGSTLSYEGTYIGIASVENRVYSFGASGFTVVMSKDQCKKNGWKDLVDANGKAFKNQGQCVSYIANGKAFIEKQEVGIYHVSGGSSDNVLTSDPYEGKVSLITDRRDNSLTIKGNIDGLTANHEYFVWMRDLGDNFTGTHLFEYLPLGYYKLVSFTTDSTGSGEFGYKINGSNISAGSYNIQVALNDEAGASNQIGYTVAATAKYASVIMGN